MRTLLTLLLGFLVLPQSAAQDTGPRAESKTALDAAAACCTRFAEFHYRRLPANFAEAFPVGRLGPAFGFPTGKSFFLAFELPRIDGNYAIEVTTRITGYDRGQAQMSIFCPTVLLLDEAHRPVAYRRNPSYLGVPPRTRSGPPGMSTIVLVNEAARGARYIVFLTDPASLAGTAKFSAQSGRIPGMTAINEFGVPCSYEGLIEVKGPGT